MGQSPTRSLTRRRRGDQNASGMDDDQRQDWERLVQALGAGFLVRWEQHDPEAVEQEVGPMTRERAGERELQQAWFA